jgi:hypothetical protein
MKYDNPKLQCRSCGWTFTVYHVPQTDVYSNCGWFCPHCGQEVKPHIKVLHGQCKVCGHYGDDCTGKSKRNLGQSDKPAHYATVLP